MQPLTVNPVAAAQAVKDNATAVEIAEDMETQRAVVQYRVDSSLNKYATLDHVGEPKR